MFDLEQAIDGWRRNMASAGIKTTELEELENHLREEAAQQQRAGLRSEAAFAAAVQQVGTASDLEAEFKIAGGSNWLSSINTNRAYETALVAFLILLILSWIPAPGLDGHELRKYFTRDSAGVSIGHPLDAYDVFIRGGFQRQLPIISRSDMVPAFPGPKWLFGLLYLLGMSTTLYLRHCRPAVGRRATRILNLVLLPIFPFGTFIGIFGLTQVDREKHFSAEI